MRYRIITTIILLLILAVMYFIINGDNSGTTNQTEEQVQGIVPDTPVVPSGSELPNDEKEAMKKLRLN